MRILLIIIVLLFPGCQPKNESVTSLAYIQEIDLWHARRVEALKAPSGWLNVAGLLWLQEGINSFGSSAENTIVFPEKMTYPRAGFLLLEKGKVVQTLLPEVNFTSRGATVPGTMLVFNPDSTRQPVMESGSLRWFVIKRDTRYGIRLRDLDHENLSKFAGIERFPVEARWKVSAKWEATPDRTIPITNILGQTTPQAAPGILVFVLDGKEYRLDALDEGSDELFIIFGDATNTKETYGAGRYLYVPKPDSFGTVPVDFNKAENPPCAFTEFATCPLPPIQNVMPIAIEAGEKDYHLP